MLNSIVSAFNAIKPFRGKQRLLKAVFRWIPFSTARSYYGVKMVRNVSDSTWRAGMVGSYGDFISNYISSLSGPFKFLDIGANQGLFGLCASENPNCQAIIAFEPNPSTFSLLARNISLSNQEFKFLPVCAAISSLKTGTIEMAVPINHSGASSSQTNHIGKYRKFNAIIINGDLLKQIVSPNDSLVLHAKIDVEGAEIFVLDELVKTGLLDAISSIIIEISSNIEGSAHVDEVIEFFEKNGWVLSSRSEGHDPNSADKLYDAVYVNPKLNTIVASD